MIVVSAADERFAAHFAAMLHSAWTHHPTAEFYLLDCGVEPQTRSTLADYASALGIRLSIITIDAARLDGLPTTSVMSAATYARLLIPDLLPHASRALYIDADAIVVGNLSELWEMDMGHAAIAGVHDRGGRYEPRELGIDLANYVNAGVLLMNLTVWRREHLGAAGLDYVRRHKPDLLDQTAISAVCAGRIRFLSDKWNYTPAGIRRAFRGQPVTFILRHNGSPGSIVTCCSGNSICTTETGRPSLARPPMLFAVPRCAARSTYCSAAANIGVW